MRLLCLVFLALSVLPVGAQTAAKPQLRELNEAEQYGAELYRGSGATGLLLVVVRGDKVFVHGYGETAPGSNIAPSEESVIRLCSLTKIFTTDLLAKLAADGTLRFEDTLQQYAPQGRVVPQKGAEITLLELATHTSGLSREIGTPPRHTPHFTYPGYATRWDWLQSAQLEFTPGTAAVYSNIGFDLLADAIANAAHTRYPTLLSQRTLLPLQMWNTTFYPSAAQCAHLLQGSRDEGPCTATENTMGSSGLYSTPSDIAKWLHYLLGEDAARSEKKTDDALAVYLLPTDLTSQSGLAHAGRPSGIGLGWMHLGAEGEASHIVEKTGGGAGFTTYIALHPASGTALFFAATDGPPHAGTPGFHLYRAANNALLALAGLPPLPEPPHSRSAARRRPHATRTARVHRHAPTQTGRGAAHRSR